MTATIDPIDFEVLRHRLWMINDEQGRVAAQVSGSPAVYEAKDFNTSLLTPEGESLYVGIYTTRLSLCLNFAVKTVIERLGDTLGIEEGDAFVTNDPWCCGASHMNDILMVAPIHWRDRLVCWAGLAMHETDVGGPNPGSFTVGTPDVFGEGPLIPPIKMVERGRIREDLEALVIRNSRTSEVNGLNVRARIAAINRTSERIREMIGEYGVDTFMALQGELLRNVAASFARRLRALPDGSWRGEGFLDHDGNENRLYRVRLRMTKTGERLEFDYRGTDPQARGAINCTRVGLEGGTLSAVLPMLCYDMPWSPGAIMPAIDFVSEEGTLNNATHPAAVSMATVAAAFATSHVASQAIGKMLACSALGDGEAQANWSPAWQGATLAGRHEDGRPFTAVLLDQSGGGGRAWKDGPDTGGLPGTPAMGIANVETYEKEYPILYVYRRQSRDTGGAGRYRGGVGTEAMLVPHRAEGPIDLTLLTHGASQPESQGLYGGYPSSVQVRALLRGADIRARFARGEIAGGLDDAACEAVEPLAAKTRTIVDPDDAWVLACAGGGGYGDALLRPPEAVAEDIRAGLCSREVARDVYGVALDGAGGVDADATDAARASIRARRLAEGRPFAEAFPDCAAPAASPPGRAGEPVGAVGQAVVIAERGGAYWYDCRSCRHPLAPVGADPKTGALVRGVPMAMLSPWNRFGLTGEIAVNEYVCPACAHLLSVEVRLAGDPPLLDTEVRIAPGRVRDAAE